MRYLYSAILVVIVLVLTVTFVHKLTSQVEKKNQVLITTMRWKTAPKDEVSQYAEELVYLQQHPECPVIKGSPGEFNLIPLLSLPGAGNTWTRFLIEQATGYLTGSVYQDHLLEETLKGECLFPENNETVVVKSHHIMDAHDPISLRFSQVFSYDFRYDPIRFKILEDEKS